MGCINPPLQILVPSPIKQFPPILTSSSISTPSLIIVFGPIETVEPSLADFEIVAVSQILKTLEIIDITTSTVYRSVFIGFALLIRSKF